MFIPFCGKTQIQFIFSDISMSDPASSVLIPCALGILGNSTAAAAAATGDGLDQQQQLCNGTQQQQQQQLVVTATSAAAEAEAMWLADVRFGIEGVAQGIVGIFGLIGEQGLLLV